MKTTLLLSLLLLSACSGLKTGSTAPASKSDPFAFASSNSKPTCTAESDMVFCAHHIKSCGHVTGADSCGKTRTTFCGTCPPPISSCARTCIPPKTCGGAGVPGACG